MWQERIYLFVGWAKLYSGDIGQGGNYVQTSDPAVIAKAVNYISESRKDIKNIVVDDK